MFENIFSLKSAKRSPFISFFYALLFTFVALFAALMFFGEYLSISTLFIVTVLLVPVLVRLFDFEENLESKKGLKGYFYSHKDIFEVYMFTFLGVFAGYLLLGIFVYGTPSYDMIFSFQEGFAIQPSEGGLLFGFDMAQGVGKSLFDSVMFLIVCFLFAFLYGAGAVFLLVLSASVFALYATDIIVTFAPPTLSSFVSIIGILLYGLPRLFGLVLGSVAGGVLSKAMAKEVKGTKAFGNVVKDSLLLLGISILLVLLSVFSQLIVL